MTKPTAEVQQDQTATPDQHNITISESLRKLSLPSEQKSQLSLRLLWPSERKKQQRADALSALYDEPPSSKLKAYFKDLEAGSQLGLSAQGDVDSFILGALGFARLGGSNRGDFYGQTLTGLHYEKYFTEQWNREHPDLPITLWDVDARHQCPPSWSWEVHDAGTLALTYRGGEPLSQGLNELLQGPTTLDCGIFCQLLIWMAIRYLLGDRQFDQLFRFERGEFTLTEVWDQPMNNDRTTGNMLYPFYDSVLDDVRSDPADTNTRIRTRTLYNDPTYQAKHPGGTARLEHVTQIDGRFVIFRPGAPNHDLPREIIETLLMQDYNIQQDLADLEKVWLFTAFPHLVLPMFGPGTLGELSQEAKVYEKHILSDEDWRRRRAKREEAAQGLDFVFNFQRLKSCLQAIRQKCSQGATAEMVFAEARRLKHIHDMGKEPI